MRSALFVAGLASVASAMDVTPVEKVVQMIEGLQDKVVAEGTAEAKTYDEFACFCKKGSEEKNAAIREGETASADLQANMESEVSKREGADERLAEKEKELRELSEEKKEIEEEAAERRKKYAVEITDMTSAVTSLEEAIKVLRSSDKTSLLSVKETLSTAAGLADAMGLKHANALFQVLQIPDVPVSDYDFHSGGILNTLKDLLVDFRKMKNQVDDDEIKAQAEETQKLQANADATKAAEKAHQDAKTAKETASEAIGKISADLAVTTADLKDNQNYLIDLTDKCNDKKKMWDQRVQMRQDELTALTQALALLHDTVAANTNKNTVRLAETAPRKVVSSFLQMAKVRRARRAEVTVLADPLRERLLDLLGQETTSLHSAVLASLTAHAKADPLAKVKKLIEELILRLQEEASDEANHHGWCVKQTNLAEDKRKSNSQKINSLNDQLGKEQAQKLKLEQNIQKLTEEIETLEKEFEEYEKNHKEEQAEREKTIDEAKTGLEAVTDATKILAEFYENAKKSTSFVQQPTADDLPDAGFDSEYSGNQDDSTGVLGMLEVISSDFERTIKQTKADFKQAEADYLEFKTVTDSSLAEKNTAKEAFSSELADTKDSIENNTQDLEASIESRDSAITELIELHAACVDTGMSYEERKAKREAEIEALKNAYEILDNYNA